MGSSGKGQAKLWWGLVGALLCLLVVGCGGQQQEENSYPDGGDHQAAPITLPDLSDTARMGAEVFAAHCSECHGKNATGSSEGPPLVHIIYEPGHHADISFHLAVRQGVRQHHWQFGVMDPVEGVSDQDIDRIICYVRELQYANGIFSDPEGLAACRG